MKIDIKQLIDIIKDANIDELYLRDIGVDTTQKGNVPCPVHGGKDKNFQFDLNKRIYTCYSHGCVVGADIIELCRTYEHFEKPIEAILFLANKYNIPLPFTKNKTNTKKINNVPKNIYIKKKDINSFIEEKKQEAFRNNDIELAFEFECMTDKDKRKYYLDNNIKIKSMLEKQNYSSYKADSIINIDKYISENLKGIRESIKHATEGKNVLMVAPTGSGKTYSIINTLKELDIKALFIFPNSANVQQAIVEYKIAGAYDKIPTKHALEGNKLVAMTWDKTEQLLKEDLSEYIIVIDEIHQTYTDAFRSKAIKSLNNITNKCRGRLDITATPSKLEFEIYNKVIEYKQNIQTEYKVKLYDKINIGKVIEILNNSNNSMLLKDSISTLNYISKKVNKKSGVVISDTKDTSKLYDRIVSYSDMEGYEVLLNTSVITAGVNINNPNVTDIIVIGEKDVGKIKQYVARARGAKSINVHIFNSYKTTNEDSNVYSVEWCINENIKDVESLTNIYNKASKRDLPYRAIGIDISPINIKNIDSNIYYDKKDMCYKTDKLYIKSNAYNNYYQTRTINSFKVLLEEYFNKIEIVETEKETKKIEEEIKEHEEAIKEFKKSAIEQLEGHKKYLVGYSEIKKSMTSSNLLKYHHDMRIDNNICLKYYMEHDLYSLIINNNCRKTIDLFSDFVLDNSYSIDLSWKLATMSDEKRNLFFEQINTTIYRKINKKYANSLLNDDNIGTYTYNYINFNFGVGTSYTKEHLEALAVDLQTFLATKKKLTIKKISLILQSIFVIEVKQHRGVTGLPYKYYKNILPNPVTDKKVIRVYTIKKHIDIEDIKKELGLIDNDLSIEHLVEARINKLLNAIDETEKEVLLEGLI
ncbi:TPA: DEAD/DEAH box helicase [Clostridioides difficile]|uniref:DEAD/DEAH box helicase domain n=51 Tax=Clostridioides difficile TaxID=1496 RepID=A0A2H5BSJ7_CLODI|nr:DEAD/DEAH box helicase [Clostridioides difficile]EQG73044.1 DEAD/DEAH box helicase family protein [Clostridioides difficile DA00165]AUG89624.1 DEAD/DEAH box helicase domain [Clostridioides difficile]EAA0011060.1 DEAD/DEAH box helicase [Clostridioides difficile]EGT3780603.1 DEAD/DEAH box helicase [Clostridioides difficile]EGT3821240.1 DEAD/DEAH box helicase [Clostridioides difficile]